LLVPASETRMNAGFPVANNSVRNRRGISMRKIGCARVSSVGQNLDRQLGALIAEGCDRVFQEKASGKSIKNRPELEKAIGALGTGDILVLGEWDRCTRSMIDGVAIIERINARGALVKVLDKPHLDLTTPLGRGFLAFLSAMAEDERQRILKRANAGRTAARQRGARFGRKPALSAEQQADAPSGAWPAEQAVGR
jgi:DNA invertase Pin-like site-specific DNA recombinase